ncbi:uncharacterized protein A4U43_C09F670 [Asparagus officinalis]|uniref:Uncharacterized protein n=1 Tax=Asparagus officinalis TaxID=4686 RepID=A0A5P1E643_ASPOF|nr:uncharacterized protein A4U43_C09F670 [Asparagus officinalis]
MSSLAAFSSGSRASVSNLLRSSRSGVIGVPLRILGGSRAMSFDLRRGRRVNVMAKIVKKGKVKHEIDPNAKIVQKMAAETGLDSIDQVLSLESKNTHSENNLQLVTSSVNFFDTQPESIKASEATIYEVVYFDAPGNSQLKRNESGVFLLPELGHCTLDIIGQISCSHLKARDEHLPNSSSPIREQSSKSEGEHVQNEVDADVA